MALVTLLAFMPSLLLSPVAGVLADRYDRRLLMVLGDSLSAIGLVYILICMLSGEALLWQICVGVTISSVFSSLLDPAYKATVTDLLTEEQYTKASGLVQVAGSAKYLISPIIAGFLLVVSDIKLLLVIDICTFFVTVSSALAVRRGLVSKKYEQTQSFFHEFKDGWRAVSENRGVLVLVMMTSVLIFYLGIIETLSIPMLLTFTSSSVIGTVETFVAMGMLVSSVIIGFLPIKKGYVKILSFSLFFEGVFMAAFGLRENIILICISGFFFFAMMPFANSTLDFLVRTNIDNAVQGRAWSLIGVISQLGFVVAYALSGILADYVFTPLLVDGGLLADSVGKITGTGQGRGMGLLIIIAGILLCVTSFILFNLKSVKKLENRGDVCITE
ncbi:DHA3 family macrolide efflux protein-like MFS transporter [Lysinibacillus sp. RC46]|uniref:MFS transporter n=1 Tax=Lysinibacillus sp. RC46 TaxID=3156295 RepID=UPI003514DFF2